MQEGVVVQTVALHLKLQTLVGSCYRHLTLNRCVSVLDVTPCTLVGNAGLEVGSHSYDCEHQQRKRVKIFFIINRF